MTFDFDLIGFYQTYTRYCLLHKERTDAFLEAKVSYQFLFVMIIIVHSCCSPDLGTMFIFPGVRMDPGYGCLTMMGRYTQYGHLYCDSVVRIIE